MNILLGQRRRARAVTLTVLAFAAVMPIYPAMAQDASAEARMRRMESEIKALQRKVFPGGDGKYFTPEITPATPTRPDPGQPATSALTDMLSRLDALEAQLTRLTSQTELNTNRIALLEARLGAPAAPETDGAVPAPAPSVAPPVPAPATSTNLNAMTGGGATVKPAAATSSAPVSPSSQRLAAVSAIVKPQTGDTGDDEYSYGFRLWEAKFYPEAQQQLKLTVDKYPRHSKISYARNLLGRAYLDDGKPRDAATWFLQNYQTDKNGARAGDSLLYLAESMRQLKDTNRACIALAEFAETYPAEAAGRLKAQYDRTRNGVKCN